MTSPRIIPEADSRTDAIACGGDKLTMDGGQEARGVCSHQFASHVDE